MAKKEFEKALEEFSKALTLAPYHEDLNKTVTKLKASIEKTKDKILGKNVDQLGNVQKIHLFNPETYKQDKNSNNETPPSVF